MADQRMDLRRPRAGTARPVGEAERTLDTDVVMVFQPTRWGTVDDRMLAAEGLHPVELEADQLECLQGLERLIGGVAVAYRRDADESPPGASRPHSSDSGSTSTDHGGPGSSPRTATRVVAAQDHVEPPAVVAPRDVGRRRPGDVDPPPSSLRPRPQAVGHRRAVALGRVAIGAGRWSA